MPWTIRVLLTASAATVVATLALAPSAQRRAGSHPEDTARHGLQLTSDAILLFDRERARLPTSLDELLQPRAREDEAYLPWQLRDPWDRPFRFEVVDERARVFEVRSGGPDARIGTGDDLVLRTRARRK
jgi:hypothetical protein